MPLVVCKTLDEFAAAAASAFVQLDQEEGVMTYEQRAKLVGVEEEGRVLVFADGGRWRLPEGFSAGGRFTKESSFYPHPLAGFLLKATGMKASIELHANDQVAHTRAAIEDIVGGLATLLRVKHVP